MGASIIAKLLGWTKMPQWALELIVIGVIAGGIWYWHHATYISGIHAQQTADDKASLKVQMDAAAETTRLQAKADLAKDAHDDELKDLGALRAAQPIDSVRLCGDASQSNGSVSQGSGENSGTETASTASGSVQPMPSGDSGSRQRTAPVDISQLLDALAASADSVSADLREYHGRE